MHLSSESQTSAQLRKWRGSGQALLYVDADLKKIAARVIEQAKELCISVLAFHAMSSLAKALEPAFQGAGQRLGTEIWRIENFQPVPLPKSDHGKFYSGDLYIVLQTSPGRGSAYLYDIHFWLGKDTSLLEQQPLKLLELDAILGGCAVQHRELQGHESDKFLSYFKPRIIVPLGGGVASGFKKPEEEVFETWLYFCKGKRVVRLKQVATSLNSNECFLLQSGSSIFSWHGNQSTFEQQQLAAKVLEFLKSKRSCFPKLDAIKSATADILTGLKRKLVTLTWECKTCSNVEVSGLDIGWGQNVRNAAIDGDCVLVVVDASKALQKIDDILEEGMGTFADRPPTLLVLNKKDLIKPGEIAKKLEWYEKSTNVDEVIPVSAKYGHGVDDVKDWILSKLPFGPAYYPKVHNWLTCFLSPSPSKMILALFSEVDLDLGNYERFLDVTLTRDNNITTGKIYQVVPHITDAIKDWIVRVAAIPVDGKEEPADVCVIELGGTVGDIESMPFIEALRQLISFSVVWSIEMGSRNMWCLVMEFIEIFTELDVLISLAIACDYYEGPMCQPVVSRSPCPDEVPCLSAKSLGHPIIRSDSLGTSTFVSNDVTIGGSSHANFIQLTGPNMDGKSTLLRQVCLAVILAQLGADVPAENFEMSPVDQIFVRMGVKDHIMAGQSTFLTQLLETASMLANRRREFKQPIRTWHKMRQLMSIKFLQTNHGQVLYPKYQRKLESKRLSRDNLDLHCSIPSNNYYVFAGIESSRDTSLRLFNMNQSSLFEDQETNQVCSISNLSCLGYYDGYEIVEEEGDRVKLDDKEEVDNEEEFFSVPILGKQFDSDVGATNGVIEGEDENITRIDKVQEPKIEESLESGLIISQHYDVFPSVEPCEPLGECHLSRTLCRKFPMQHSDGKNWNGIQQRKNSYQDGVYGSTCPIPPGKSFTYTLQMKDQIGSFFYFPSLAFHKAAGGFGGIRILSRPLIPVPFPEPVADWTLLIGDWYKKDHKMVKAILDRGKRLPYPDGILINGRGSNGAFFYS
ncbi:hypothetical protein Vadar_030612 [Vaccinium darrowii]|uniref:Uncharacterized protein n=1 Tax=Vaccinium darrowii TaxID=229202 RepID=A0ACB7YHK0_9ERIC|nr:hypothetical protein Vadar_030612 [Vaccinium darrowii]